MTLSLPVIPPEKRHVKRSGTSRWRAAVLITVNVLLALHILMWVVSGMRDGVRETISPVEPSESMYTLETGVVNAGFIFFAAAVLSTLILGRFFCGWGCHVVALQDLCSWIMTRIRVKPRPFRSRVLVWAPVYFGLYMFVWPMARRGLKLLLDNPKNPADLWDRLRPWVGETADFKPWSAGLIVEDFWKTFAPWYVAIPFLLVCGFALVYFLGSKGFCTYGCPYGGFFGPADLLSPGKIRVTDACEGCGHCTAVCTSNVRVHEEVRDFGMVVDPGCMKCMDCISVCPNDALYFGLGTPTVLARPRNQQAAARRAAKRRNWDLSWPEELLVGVVFAGSFVAWRGFLNQVPMLMAIGLAGMSAFLAWKLLCILRDPHVRLQSLQLKYRGRLKRAGWVFAPLAVLFLATGAYAGVIRYHRWWGGMLVWKVAVPTEIVLVDRKMAGGGWLDADAGAFLDQAGNQTPFSNWLSTTPAEQRRSMREYAQRALAHYVRSGPARGGGWGWALRPDDLQSIAYLELVCGRTADTERTLLEIMDRGRPTDTLIPQLGQVMKLRGASDEDVLATFERVLRQQPHLTGLRATLATFYVRNNRPAEAIRTYDDAITSRPGDAVTRKDAGMLLVQLGQTERGLALLAEAERIAGGQRGMTVRRSAETMLQIGRAYLVVQRPDRALAAIQKALAMNADLPGARWDLAKALYSTGQQDRAIDEMKSAARSAPDDPDVAAHVAEMLRAAGHGPEASVWLQKAQELQAKRLRDASGKTGPGK